MLKPLKDIWNNQRDIEEAEWYILTALFIVVWMWLMLKIVP